MTSLVDKLYAWADNATTMVGTFTPEGRTESVGIVRIMYGESAPAPVWPEEIICGIATDPGTAAKALILYSHDINKPILAIDWHDACEYFVDAADRYDMYIIEVYTHTTMSRILVEGTSVTTLGTKGIDKAEFDTVSTMFIDIVPNARGGKA